MIQIQTLGQRITTPGVYYAGDRWGWDFSSVGLLSSSAGRRKGMGVIWGESVEQEEKRVVEGFALLSFSSNNHRPFFTLPAMLPDSGHRKVKKKEKSSYSHRADLGENKREMKWMGCQTDSSRPPCSLKTFCPSSKADGCFWQSYGVLVNTYWCRCLCSIKIYVHCVIKCLKCYGSQHTLFFLYVAFSLGFHCNINLSSPSHFFCISLICCTCLAYLLYFTYGSF